MKLTCETCGKGFVYTPSGKGGRPPKHCIPHRKTRGEARDVEGIQERRNAKRRQAPARAEAVSQAASPEEVLRLATGLAVSPDPVWAARTVGLGQSGDELVEMVRQARERHQGVIDGEPAELGRHLMAAIYRFVGQATREMHIIAPKDLLHNARALAQVHALLVSDNTPRIAQLTMMVVGADGVPFDPNATPQPKQAEEKT